jgi:hypothetical protein
VQLQLKADPLQLRFQKPGNHLQGCNPTKGRAHQAHKSFLKMVLPDRLFYPIPISTTGNDKFDLIGRFKNGQVWPIIPLAFTAIWAFQVHNDVDPWIHSRDVVGTAGFQKNGASRVGEFLHQGVHFLLQQWFSPGDFNEWTVVVQNLANYLFTVQNLPLGEGMGSVTPDAPEVTPRQADKHTGQPRKGGFSLDTPVNLMNE